MAVISPCWFRYKDLGSLKSLAQPMVHLIFTREAINANQCLIDNQAWIDHHLGIYLDLWPRFDLDYINLPIRELPADILPCCDHCPPDGIALCTLAAEDLHMDHINWLSRLGKSAFSTRTPH